MVDRLMPSPTESVPHRELVPFPHDENPVTREISRQPRPVVVSVLDSSIGAADTLPKMLDNLPPIYPHQAYVERREGTVILRVLITAQGTVGNLEIATSSGHPILDAAAVRAIRSWRFEPARRFGRPIPYTVDWPVRFALN